MNCASCIGRAAGLIKKMEAKGKQAEAGEIVAEFQAQPVPVHVFGGGPEAMAELDRLSDLRAVKEEDLPPIKGSGSAAQAEEERREELRRLWAKDAQWQLVIDEIQERVKKLP